MKRTARLAAIAAAMALVVPGSPAGAAPDEPAGKSGNPTVAWAPCEEDPTAECGTLSVPVDWSRPRGERFDLALARRKATDPARRIGSLVVNPGGPGGSGVDFVLFAPDYFSADLRARFDLVGFDPRGVARSHPILCSLDLLVAAPPPVLTSQADFDRMVRYNRDLGNDCRRHSGPLIDHVDVLSVVRDMDAIRAAVGDRKLTYYGVSYGTLMGQQYAEEFPDRVRALVLDSNMDHSLGTAGFLLTEAGTVQDSFNEFVKGCRADAGCVLHDSDIRALWADLLARAGRGELTLPGTSIVLTQFDLVGSIFGSFYGPDWRGLAEFLVALDTGVEPEQASAAAALGAALGAAAAGGRRTTVAAELVENSFQPQFCGDWELPIRNYTEFAALLRAQRLVAHDVLYSPLALSATVACLGWSAQTNNPQHPLRARPAKTLYMTNALHDPATGYAWALNAKRQLGDAARLLTYKGWGHGVYGRSDCVSAPVDAYLIAGALPRPGAQCAAVPPNQAAAARGATAQRPLTSGPRPGIRGY
jgi:pimeloyl-ACP methyl ester carboxylesterase